MSNDKDTLGYKTDVSPAVQALARGQHPIELEFAALLDAHIDQLRSRGVTNDILTPYERELRHCLPRRRAS